jgi:hypothetical protein
MIETHHDRRRHPRLAISRACKMFDDRSVRYRAGVTANMSRGGALIRMHQRCSLEPGDPVYIGVAPSGRHGLMSREEMIHAEVVRIDDEDFTGQTVAVRFLSLAETLPVPLAMAA